ncbi:MAG: hypothetical protein F6K47_30895 [Symploca sp. SIO2E6]|nr:hypothetical protein [Symploca sp. SIO2E6]
MSQYCSVIAYIFFPPSDLKVGNGELGIGKSLLSSSGGENFFMGTSLPSLPSLSPLSFPYEHRAVLVGVLDVVKQQ